MSKLPGDEGLLTLGQRHIKSQGRHLLQCWLEGGRQGGKELRWGAGPEEPCKAQQWNSQVCTSKVTIADLRSPIERHRASPRGFPEVFLELLMVMAAIWVLLYLVKSPGIGLLGNWHIRGWSRKAPTQLVAIRPGKLGQSQFLKIAFTYWHVWQGPV